MNCVLCNAINEHRVVKDTKHSFCVVCKEPLKLGHVLVIPKRHVTQDNFSTLPENELKDLFELLETMQHTLNKLNLGDTLICKNSGVHSSLPHLHFHVFPSKGGVRDLVANLEKVPSRKDIPKEQEITMRDKIISLLD